MLLRACWAAAAGVAVMTLTMLAAGCATQPTGDGEAASGAGALVRFDTFGGRWWNYYERGVTRLNAGNLEAARSDFEEALQGRREDSWRARTYGLHFVEYFPQRELGVTLYELGEFDAAEALLRESLEDIDTERAHRYIDLITQARLAAGQLTDDAAPALDTTVANGGLVNERFVGLAIAARDDVGVSQVEVAGAPLYQRGATVAQEFRSELLLAPGEQRIAVAARDLAGKDARTEVPVTVDLTGPNVGIVQPAVGAVTGAASIAIEIVAVDAHGVDAVLLDGEPLAMATPAERSTVTAQVQLVPGENTFIVSARDRAGNETFTAVRVLRGDAATAGARLWRLAERQPALLRHASATGQNPLHLAQAAEAAPVNEIRLKSPSEDRPYRHNRTLRVAGEVVAEAGVEAVSVNGEPFTPLTGAPRESFNKRLPLDGDDIEGPKEVRVAAQAADGATLEETVTVEVRPAELSTPDSFMPVAVLAFGANGVDGAVAEELRALTEAALGATDRFFMVDRTQLAEVLTEQQLSEALGDPDAALDVGRIVPAQVFLVAEVFARDAGGVEVLARVVNTETGQLMTNLDTFIADASDRAQVDAGTQALAAQLEAFFPRLSGEVTAVRGGGSRSMLLLNWTEEDGVRPDTYCLLVVEDRWEDEVTGEVLFSEFLPVGRARIENVQQSGSRAQTVPGASEEDVPVEQGMPAITM